MARDCSLGLDKLLTTAKHATSFLTHALGSRSDLGSPPRGNQTAADG
jgi:hypothetical protein